MQTMTLVQNFMEVGATQKSQQVENSFGNRKKFRLNSFHPFTYSCNVKS